ncbi:GAF domain-containing protein [Labedaea rhizosphaerae]|uniref:GAF domain-containing protein n=1 Tax=Labedaea rhizosphaerae TaxID=598644 RepID=A0A4R6S6E7_LABRH|nr:GAF domain-containing protein [Labedaea rhizosphaerae]TDP94923.1 GAF domain-containing protein [Labedaea rhizosphaerae]
MTRADGAAAVLPGTDLVQHSRALHRAHDAVMSGARPPTPLRGVVSRSWSRVLGFGLDPSGRNTRTLLAPDEVERRRDSSPLHLVVDELRAVLSSVADASHFISVVTDADGVILWREGAPGVLRRADSLGFGQGATWTEDHVGTNAIGTALAEHAPVQLFSAEHFEQGQHPWYCTAAPLHDPRTGDLLGVVDVSGPAMTLHPAIGALIHTATKLAEARLWQHHREQLDRLRASAAHLSGPFLVVDDDGWVAHQAGLRVRDRVAAPAEGRPLTVPGLGLCVPERLPGGWLVRQAGARQTVHAHLSTEPDGGAVLDVQSDQDGWRTRLSRRHAEVLRALHQTGPDGLTAADLSRHLFGDDDHQVTVRAEISRLRRIVGPLVTAAPYRLDGDVELTVDEQAQGQSS